MNKNKIAILTTVANFNLYKKTAHFFPKEIRKFVFDGRNGMYGIDSLCFAFKKLKKLNIDWLIMADEDVIFEEPDIVFEIIKEMKDNEYFICGVRDGGEILHRNFNPNVVNTFFCILNFKEIVKIWDRKEVLKNQYIKNNEFYTSLNLRYSYDINSLYEPYYCFFLWLLRKKKKTLFLDSKMFNDNITNEIYFDMKPFAIHTWYARSYGVNSKHTDRINFFLNKLKPSKTNLVFEVYTNRFFTLRKKLDKVLRKVNKFLRK